MIPPLFRSRPSGCFALLLALLLQGPSLPARVPPGTEVGRHASNLPLRVDDLTPGADLSDVTFYEGVDLSGVRFEQVDLSGAMLRGVNLEQATFIKGCWKRPVDFSSARLAGASFQKVDIHEADFRLADLTDADLSTCLVRQCRREGANETGTRWRKPRQLAPAGAGDLPAGRVGAGSGPSPDPPEAKAPRAPRKRKPEEATAAAEPPLKKLRRDAWESNLAKLVQYQAAKGHTQVAKADDPDLGSWVVDQHSLYRRKIPALTPERIAALEKVPTWQWRTAARGQLEDGAGTWAAHLARLVQYQADKGHTAVAEEHDPQLSRWVADQQSWYRLHDPRLPPERIAALEKVPTWQWQAAVRGDRKPQAAVWEAHLAVLKAFAAAHTTTRMRHDHMEGTLKLGRWVGDQRSLKRRKAPSLTPERIAALEAVPHWEW